MQAACSPGWDAIIMQARPPPDVVSTMWSSSDHTMFCTHLHAIFFIQIRHTYRLHGGKESDNDLYKFDFYFFSFSPTWRLFSVHLHFKSPCAKVNHRKLCFPYSSVSLGSWHMQYLSGGSSRQHWGGFSQKTKDITLILHEWRLVNTCQKMWADSKKLLSK